ncbi:MAG: hypothetical protein K8W52_35385 [Deltaproteobacteria bacterium]|nr:hypothetical protein [Deltaproteobacteria bacterium]
MLRFASVALFASAVVAGCNPYDPDLGGRPFKCGTDDPRCPDGYTCVDVSATNSVCEKNGGAGPDARKNADASTVQCGTDIQLEPNDDTSHAFETPVRSTSATYSLAQLALCPSSDIDTYGFTTTAINQQVTITVTYNPSAGQLNLNVLNSNGTPSATGTPNGNTLVVSTNRLSIGHWFAQVTGAAGVQANYDLDISVTP